MVENMDNLKKSSMNTNYYLCSLLYAWGRVLFSLIGGGGRFVSANLILLNRIFKKNVNLYMLHVNMLI